MSYPSKTEFDNLRNSLPLTYQTRGNYAFRTDLASNINTALKNVNTALASYAKKTDIPVVPANVATKFDLANYALRSDIPVVPSNVATKSDLANYALTSDLTKYQPVGRYVSPDELEAYQPKGDYASAKDLVGYAKSSDLANFQPKGDYALAKDLDGYAKSSDLANYVPNSALANLQPKGDYAKTSDLVPYAKTSDLTPYAKTADIAGAYQVKGDYAKTSDLTPYAKTADIAGAYQVKGDYAKTSDLASYAKTSDLANYQTTGNSYVFKSDIVGYAKLGAANDFLGVQTFKSGINLEANSKSYLGGAVSIPNATGISTGSLFISSGNLNVTNVTAGTITSTTMNLGTLNVNSISAASIAGYQTAGNYVSSSDFTTLRDSLPKTYQTAGNYALATDLQKLQAQNTFNAQAIFNAGAVFSPGGLNPIEVKGTPGLKVEGGTTLNKVKFSSGDDPSSYFGPGITTNDTGDARVNVQDKSGNLISFYSGTTKIGGLKLQDGNPSFDFKNGSGTIGSMRFGGAGTTSFLAGHTLAMDSNEPGGSFIVQSNATQGSTKVGINNKAPTKALDVTGDASISGSLTVKDLSVIGAPTFNALTTFEKNAIVKTIADQSFKVTGPGGLKVPDGPIETNNLNANNITTGNLNANNTATGNLKVNGNIGVNGSTTINNGILSIKSNFTLKEGQDLKLFNPPENGIYMSGIDNWQQIQMNSEAGGYIDIGKKSEDRRGRILYNNNTQELELATSGRDADVKIDSNGQLIANRGLAVGGTLKVNRIQIGNHIITADDFKVLITARDGGGGNEAQYQFHRGSGEWWSKKFVADGVQAGYAGIDNVTVNNDLKVNHMIGKDNGVYYLRGSNPEMMVAKNASYRLYNRRDNSIAMNKDGTIRWGRLDNNGEWESFKFVDSNQGNWS